MGATSRSSTLRNGGRPLRLAYPISGKNTFRPSGNPTTDEPEFVVEDGLEFIRSVFGTNTKEGIRRFDRMHEGNPRWSLIKQECAYWDRLRFLKMKSPRARKRAEQREAKALAARNRSDESCY